MSRPPPCSNLGYAPAWRRLVARGGAGAGAGVRPLSALYGSGSGNNSSGVGEVGLCDMEPCSEQGRREGG
jgi:hypothetical protein